MVENRMDSNIRGNLCYQISFVVVFQLENASYVLVVQVV